MLFVEFFWVFIISFCILICFALPIWRVQSHCLLHLKSHFSQWKFLALFGSFIISIYTLYGYNKKRLNTFRKKHLKFMLTTFFRKKRKWEHNGHKSKNHSFSQTQMALLVFGHSRNVQNRVPHFKSRKIIFIDFLKVENVAYIYWHVYLCKLRMDKVIDLL